MYDIIEQGVTVVESLELARQPMPKMEVCFVFAFLCSISIVVGLYSRIPASVRVVQDRFAFAFFFFFFFFFCFRL